MKSVIIATIILFFNISFASEVTVIELHNKSIDQLINENSLQSNTDENIIIQETQLAVDNVDEKTELLPVNNNELLDNNIVTVIPNIWQKIAKEDLFFLLNNINKIESNVLKRELLSSLDMISIIPKDFNKEEFNNLIIDTLLRLGERKKSYEIIKSFQIQEYKKNEENNIKNNFYKEFILNYLFSTYKLSEACSYRNDFKNLNLSNDPIFFLKTDIFCLVLKEKFDEADLLNSLLIESEKKQDEYFQFLFNKLQGIDNIELSQGYKIKEENIYLYSAMHRIGNLPLNEKFLKIDPINLSLPIVLSNSTDIELRLKSAHFAYYNKLIGVDSLSALYQRVDFTFDELNNPSEFYRDLGTQIEVSMAYFYQLINIQILPITRIEAIIKFWEFAEENNLERIAYDISIKNLNTIMPSNELSSYGPIIAKAYILSKDFVNANKWLVFSENSLNLTDPSFVYKLNSVKLLYNLYNLGENDSFANVLINNLEYMQTSITENDKINIDSKNEILNLIFSCLNPNEINLFYIEKKISEVKSMPSLYLLNNIRVAIESLDQINILLSVILSLDGKRWNEIHPEHLRLVLLSFKYYNDGEILNDILLEILKDHKII